MADLVFVIQRKIRRLKPAVYVEEMADVVKQMTQEYDYPIPEIWIEPGRSLVGDAGTTIYTAGSTKEVPGVRTYVAVDGGMSDNIRPALYDANYSAVHCKSDERTT